MLGTHIRQKCINVMEATVNKTSHFIIAGIGHFTWTTLNTNIAKGNYLMQTQL